MRLSRPIHRLDGGSRRREPRLEAVGLELEERLAVAQSLQTVSAELLKADSRRKGGLDGSDGGRRKHDLTAVADGADAGGSVQRQTYVAALGQYGAPRVEADPDLYVRPVWPRPRRQTSLDSDRRLDSTGRPLEDSEELVRTGVDLAAARALDCAPEKSTHITEQ